MREDETIAHIMVLDKKDRGIDQDVRISTGIFYKRNQFMDKIRRNPPSSIMEANEDDAIKVAGSDLKFDYAIMTWEGNIFSITDYHDFCVEYIDELDERTNGQWLVAGHLMDQYQNRIFHNDANADGYKHSFWLYPITALINLKKWRELGMPQWGQENTAEIIAGQPSSESVHDGYTPLELKPTDQRVHAVVKKGWNFIDQSLQAGMTVYNLSDKIRSVQTHLYPEVNPEAYNNFWRSLFGMPKLSDNYKKVFEKLISCKTKTRMDPRTWRFFIKNTEEYFPLLADQDHMPWSEIDCLLIPSSGFKDFIITQSSRTDRHAVQIIHYDILEKCVEIKKRINQQWDGTRSGLEELLTRINSENMIPDVRDNIFHMNAMKSYSEVYDDMLPFFDSEEDLRLAWLKFQQQDHAYIVGDMLDLDDAVRVRKLVVKQNVYLCLSDIAGWRNNILGYGHHNLRKNIATTVKCFTGKGYKGLVDYKDPGTDIQHLQNLDVCLNHIETNKPNLIGNAGNIL